MTTTTSGRDNRVLDCGHKPNPHCEHTTGTAHTQDGREICWDCSNKMEREAMATADRFGCYLSGDGKRLETWPGGELARVTMERNGNHNIARTITRVRAVAPDGSHWYGMGGGRGMYIRVRRVKG